MVNTYLKPWLVSNILYCQWVLLSRLDAVAEWDGTMRKGRDLLRS